MINGESSIGGKAESLEMKRFNGDLITMFQYLKCVTLVKEEGEFLSWFKPSWKQGTLKLLTQPPSLTLTLVEWGGEPK